MTFGDDRLPARFWSKVQPEPMTGCWRWIPKCGVYGQFWLNRTNRLPHRVAYLALVGPIPDGLQLDHVKARGCSGPGCVNPAHLEPVTPRENILRGNTIQAANLAKTHCLRGHELSGRNLLSLKRPGRHPERACRTCRADRARDRYREMTGVPPDRWRKTRSDRLGRRA